MSLSESALAIRVAAATSDGLPPQFYTTDDGPVWHGWALDALRALGVPDHSLEMLAPLAPPEPDGTPSKEIRSGQDGAGEIVSNPTSAPEQPGTLQPPSWQAEDNGAVPVDPHGAPAPEPAKAGPLRLSLRRTVERLVKPSDGPPELRSVAELASGFYTDGTYLFRAGDDAPSEDGKQKPLREEKFPRGVPVVFSAWRPEGRSERKATEESWMRLGWSTLPELGTFIITAAELNSGECWELFQGLSITSKRDIARYADLAKTQQDLCGISRVIVPRTTGLHQDTSGTWHYHLPDGRRIGGNKPQSDREIYPIDDGNILCPDRATAWEAFELPSAPVTLSDLSWLTGTLYSFDPKGRLTALACMSARSLASSIVPCKTVWMLLGETGSGKTSSALLVRGIIGPSSENSAPDVPFQTVSAAGLGVRIAPIKDAPVIIDDFHPNDDSSTENQIKAGYERLDNLCTAYADGTEFRPRATRDGRKKSSPVPASFPVLTAETLDKIQPSRLRRMACMIYKPKEIDTEGLISQWESVQSPLTVAGHALIRNLVLRLNAGEAARSAMAHEIRACERAWIDWLFERAAEKRPSADAQIMRSIVQRFAPALTGADMLDQAIEGEHDRPMANALMAVVVDLVLEQIDVAASGGPNSITSDWIIHKIRSILTTGSGHLLHRSGRRLTESDIRAGDENERLPQDGYSKIGDRWEPRSGSVPIGIYSDDQTLIYFQPELLQDALSDRTRREGMPWRFNRQTFPAAMADIGIAIREDGRATRLIRINNRPERRLVVLRNVIYPQYAEDAEIEADNLSVAAAEEYQSNAPYIPRALTFPVAPIVPAAAPALPAIRAETNPAPVPSPTTPYGQEFPNPRFLTSDPIATLPPPRSAPPRDPLAPPRRLSPAQARRAGKDAAARSPALVAGNSAHGSSAASPPGTTPGAGNDAHGGSAAAPPGTATAAGSDAHSGSAARSPATVPAAVATQDEKRWPERAAGLDADKLSFLAPDGTIERRPIPHELRPEAACIGTLNAFAVPERITQLWLHPSYTSRTDLPENISPTKAREGIECDFAASTGSPEGWRSSGKITPWTRLMNGKQEASVIISSIDSETKLRTAEDASGILEALWAFRAATGGFCYRIDPAVTFSTMFRLQHSKGTSLKADMLPAEFPAPMRSNTTISDLNWIRPLSAAEIATGKWVHVLDKHAMYLAAMSSLPVGFGIPFYEADLDFDGRKAGYWRATVTLPSNYERYCLPHPGDAQQRRFVSGPRFYTTPTLILAKELGASITITEAWLFPDSHRPFETIYRTLGGAQERLRKLNNTPASLALNIVKSLYSKGVGNLAARKKRDSDELEDFYRPNWRDFIIAQARANIIRNMIKTGLRPFAIRTDAIYLISDSPDPMVAAGKLRIGEEPGSWDHIGSIPFDLLPDEFHNGISGRKPNLDKLTALIKANSDGT